MNRIKKFDELRSETYFRTSHELSKLGHHKRASDISLYADDVEKRESIDDWYQFIETQKEHGTMFVDIDGKNVEVCIELQRVGESFMCILVPIDFKNFEIYNNGFTYFDNIKYLLYTDTYTDKIDIYDYFNTTTDKFYINIDRKNAIRLRNIIFNLLEISDIKISNDIRKHSINDFYTTTNEELNLSTYKSAADKLRKNHPKRASDLDKWIIDTKERKYRKNYNILYDKFSKYGVFDIEMLQYRYNGKNNDKVKTKLENCAFSISFDANDNIDAIEDGGSYLSFDLSIIPNNYEDFVIYGEEWLSFSIKYKASTGGITILNEIIFSEFTIINRQSAGRFRNLLRNIFSLKSDYPAYSGGRLCDFIQYDFFAKNGVSSDYGISIHDLYDAINNISANKLYKEV